MGLPGPKKVTPPHGSYVFQKTQLRQNFTPVEHLKIGLKKNQKENILA